jgi:hypothetical protein
MNMNLSLLSQSGPAQTTDYMIAGYAVIIGLMAVYLISIWLRKRSLMRQWEMLEAIQDKDK